MHKHEEAPAERHIHHELNMFQANRLEETYSDIDAPTMKRFFFTQLYPPLEVAEGQQARNADFAALANHWMVRLILHTGLVGGLKQIVELHNLTEELDRRMVDHFLHIGDFTRDLYQRAYVTVTQKDERHRQVDLLLGSFAYVKGVVEHPRFNLEVILDRLPRFLVGNSDLIRLAKEGYGVFQEHRPLLKDFHDIIAQRERDYVERLFAGGA